MKIIEKINELITDELFITIIDFDDAIVGFDSESRIIYSVKRIVEIMMENDDVDFDDALEHVSFNMMNSKFDPELKSPIFMMDLSIANHDLIPANSNTINELIDEMDELLDFGDSHEKQFGRGMRHVLESLKINE